jgi:hypothetical protein
MSVNFQFFMPCEISTETFESRLFRVVKHCRNVQMSTASFQNFLNHSRAALVSDSTENQNVDVKETNKDEAMVMSGESDYPHEPYPIKTAAPPEGSGWDQELDLLYLVNWHFFTVTHECIICLFFSYFCLRLRNIPSHQKGN